MAPLSQKILVTGAAGAVGQAAIRALIARGHIIRGMDLRDSPAAHESVIGSVADAAKVNEAMRGVDAVVHLAATVDDADFLTELLPNNIVALHYVMEAALREKVKRVILASTIQINGGRGRKLTTLPIPPTEAWPMNAYAVTKLFAENLGKMYALRDGLSVICARIGFLPRDQATVSRFINRPGLQDIFLSHADAGRFFVRAVEAQGVEYAILWAMSRPPGDARFDLGPSRDTIGYEPQDVFPQGLPWEVPAGA